MRLKFYYWQTDNQLHQKIGKIARKEKEERNEKLVVKVYINIFVCIVVY